MDIRKTYMKKSKLHLVRLDENILYRDYNLPHMLYAKINKNYTFTGYLENISSNALYFETEDRNGLIIVPCAWVKWCVPIKEEKE